MRSRRDATTSDDGRREHRVGGPRVHVLKQLRIEAVSRGTAVARVGTGSGRDDSRENREAHEHRRRVSQCAEPTRRDGEVAARPAIRAIHENRRE